MENSCKRKPVKFTSVPKEPEKSVQCDCESTGTAKCSAGAGGPRPSQWDSFTDDKLQNLTGRNMTDYLLNSYMNFIRKRLVYYRLFDGGRKGKANKSLSCPPESSLLEIYSRYTYLRLECNLKTALLSGGGCPGCPEASTFGKASP